MCFKHCKILSLIAAAIATALIVLLISVGGGKLFYTEGKTDKRGFTEDLNAPQAQTTLANAGATGGVAAADAKPVDIAPYIAKADLKLGAQLLGQCKVCHTFEKGKPGIVGPNQYGLVGRTKGSVAGFAYSDAIKKLKGVWDFQSLSEFLTSPQAYAPGTKMGFAGLKRPEDRAAVIQYINQTFSDKPLK